MRRNAKTRLLMITFIRASNLEFETLVDNVGTHLKSKSCARPVGKHRSRGMTITVAIAGLEF